MSEERPKAFERRAAVSSIQPHGAYYFNARYDMRTVREHLGVMLRYNSMYPCYTFIECDGCDDDRPVR